MATYYSADNKESEDRHDAVDVAPPSRILVARLVEREHGLLEIPFGFGARPRLRLLFAEHRLRRQWQDRGNNPR